MSEELRIEKLYNLSETIAAELLRDLIIRGRHFRL